MSAAAVAAAAAARRQPHARERCQWPHRRRRAPQEANCSELQRQSLAWLHTHSLCPKRSTGAPAPAAYLSYALGRPDILRLLLPGCCLSPCTRTRSPRSANPLPLWAGCVALLRVLLLGTGLLLQGLAVVTASLCGTSLRPALHEIRHARQRCEAGSHRCNFRLRPARYACRQCNASVPSPCKGKARLVHARDHAILQMPQRGCNPLEGQPTLRGGEGRENAAPSRYRMQQMQQQTHP